MVVQINAGQENFKWSQSKSFRSWQYLESNLCKEAGTQGTLEIIF